MMMLFFVHRAAIYRRSAHAPRALTTAHKQRYRSIWHTPSTVLISIIVAITLVAGPARALDGPRPRTVASQARNAPSTKVAPPNQSRRQFLRLFPALFIVASGLPVLPKAHARPPGKPGRGKGQSSTVPHEALPTYHDLLFGRLPHEPSAGSTPGSDRPQTDRFRLLRNLMECMANEINACKEVNKDLLEVLNAAEVRALKKAFSSKQKDNDKIQEPDNEDKLAQNTMALLNLTAPSPGQAGDPGWKMFGDTPRQARRNVTVVAGKSGRKLAVQIRLKNLLRVETPLGDLCIAGFCLPIDSALIEPGELEALTRKTVALVAPDAADRAARDSLVVHRRLDALAHRFADILDEGDCGDFGSHIVTKMVGGLAGEPQLAKPACTWFQGLGAAFRFMGSGG